MSRPAVVVAVAVLALPAAGCGGSTGRRVAQLATTTARSGPSSRTQAATAQGRAVAFARCMRAQGVPGWPDPAPGGNGVFDKAGLTPQRLGATGSRVQAARRACARLLPNAGRPPDQAQLRRIGAQGLAFARCVRAHGVAGFPDPGSDGRIPDPATVGVDQGSPRFQAANEACRRYRPPYMPSNGAYDAYVHGQGG